MAHIWLESFELPSLGTREGFINDLKRTCYQSVYPFNVFPLTEVPAFRFDPVTILCGGNGCGKSTVLHVIAQVLGLKRSSPYNRSAFFDDYAARCDCQLRGDPEAISEGRIITSDDVFDYLLDVRSVNSGVDRRREELFDAYDQARKDGYTFRTMADYDALKSFNDSRRLTQSEFVRRRMGGNLAEQSNGESALRYFTEAIQENALYLLDEPENSLSAQRQQELCRFIADSARFYGCQFIIATHSPFILSTPGAKLFSLDGGVREVSSWTGLESVRTWYDFFMAHRHEFD